jgi:hypothetical protein
MMESTLPYFFSNFFTSIPDSNTNFQLFDHHLASSSLVGLGKNETLVFGWVGKERNISFEGIQVDYTS